MPDRSPHAPEMPLAGTGGKQPSRGPRRNLLFVAIGLVAVAALVWFISSRSGDQGRTGRMRPAATVGVARASLADVPVTLDAIGTVQPVVAATVRTQVAGTIFSIHFQEGEAVRKGQLLAQIDPRPFQLALSQAEGALNRDRAQLNVARLDLQRYETLLRQDSIARQQVDSQRAMVGQLEGTAKADEAAVGTARLNLEFAAIKAPVSGRIGLRQVDIGNYVTAGDANGIAVITQSSPIDVAFAVPQDQLPRLQTRLRQDAALEVLARDQGGDTVLARGRFLTFDNQVDTATGTVRAKARFANPDGALFPNQFVNVSLLVVTMRQAVTVPVSAIRHGTQGDFVFLLTADRKAKLQQVKLGPGAEGRSVILSGVKAGDTVISEGADNLDDGAAVTLPGQRGGPGGAGGAGSREGSRPGAAAR